MRLGIGCLIFAYALSQFYRAFMAVLAPILEQDLGLTKQDLAFASGYWFLVFAAMQLPVGMAFDRFGPKRTTALCLTVAALGALVFGLAEGPGQIQLAMALIGFGCSPILVASYFIIARQFPPAVFGTIAGLVVGIGSLGDIMGSLPLALLVESFGWRAVIFGASVFTALAAVAVFLWVQDPVKLSQKGGGSLWGVIANPALWPIFAMMLVCYAAPSALRGLWLGPYFHDVWGFSRTDIGGVGLAMGIGLVIGSLTVGPLARRCGSLKWVAFVLNFMMMSMVGLLWSGMVTSAGQAFVVFVLVGLFGSTFPIITAHARNFIEPAVMGRGVAFVNLCGMVSVGVAQQVTGRLHASWEDASAPAQAYSAIFGYFFITTLIGLAIYSLSRDRKVQA